MHERNQVGGIEGSISQFANVRCGVPQDSVLGPSPFLVFINDVLEGINCHAGRFAGCCILYTDVNNVKYQVNLIYCLNKVEEWCDEWQMIMTTKKTVCVSVTHRKRPCCIVMYAMKICWNALGAISTWVL